MRKARGIGVNRQEQVGFGFVGDFGAPFERDEGVVRAGVNHLAAHALLDQSAQPLGDVQNQILFAQAFRPNGSGIVPAMAGIENDAADLQAEHPDHGALAGCVPLGRKRGLGSCCGGGDRSETTPRAPVRVDSIVAASPAH